MTREPVTIRLEKDLLDELDAEADAEGRSRSEYIRQLLRERHDETEAELKARVSRLESVVFNPDTERKDSPVVAPNTEPESAVSGPSTADDLAETLEIPGSGAEEKRARRAWLAECLAWVQTQESVRKADVVAWWGEETEIGYETGDGVWESLVKPALDQLGQRGLVEKPHSRAYQWAGDE
jgi:Arc/MetJ-type ribon-helix-helix transcriptional regulator